MPRRLPDGERDRRLAKEVLYLHSLWHRGPHAPAPAPAPALDSIQSRSARREELDRRALRRQKLERIALYRALRRQERERRRTDRAAAEPALAPPPPASSRETLAEAAAAASAPPTADPPPPTTPPGPLAQRDAVPSVGFKFTNRDLADDDGEWSDSDGEKAEEREAAAYFTGLFRRDARLRGHYTGRWRKGRFQCMVCAAAAGGGKKKLGNAARRFRGCLALVHHALDAPRAWGRCGRRGAHRALAAVVCRMIGWDIEKLDPPRIVIDARTTATAGVQPAEEDDGAGENNGFSTDDDSYLIDEDEESDDEESVDEEEDIETGMPDPATDGDEEDSEMESNEEYAEKEDPENRMEDSSTDGDEDANELERSKEAGEKVEGSKITDGDKEAIELDNSDKFNEGSDEAKRKASAGLASLLAGSYELTYQPSIHCFSLTSNQHLPAYQGLKSSTSGVVKKLKVNRQPSNKVKRNKTGASVRKAKRPAVAARKAKQLAKKQLAKKNAACN